MASIPLAANNLKIPEPGPNALDLLRQVAQLRGAQQENQQRDLAIQQQTRQVQDDTTIREAYGRNKGDVDKTLQDIAGKVSPQAFQAAQQHAYDLKQKAQALVAQQGDIALKQSDAMQGAHDVVDKAPADQKPIIYQQQLQGLHQMGVDISQMPPQYPGDEQFQMLGTGLKTHSKLVADAMREREVSAQEMTAQGRKEQGDAALAKNSPLPNPQISFMNKQLQNRYQVLNPGQQLPPEYTVPQGANRQQYEDIDKSLQSLETAATARQNRIQQQQQQGGARSDARADKSYQFNSAQLEKVATPVDQAISRMSRLQDALAQNSPQADALIGPELLSVMAGGSGSGLRMNEAEISRVVGGRSKWETLKSSINQWQLDPSKATTITDEQRKEIRTLVQEVNSKLTKKQGILDDARQGLIGSDDPMQHRKIVADARTKMTQIDQGAGAQPSGKITVTAPDGSVHPFDTQEQADAFKKLAHIQ